MLQQNSFTPDNQMQESKALFSANLSDHLAAGIDNFISDKSFTHLEQAVLAEKLTMSSIEALRQLSLELWQDMAKQLLNAAIPLLRTRTRKNRMRTISFGFGVYQYDRKINLQVPYIYKGG